MKAKIYHNPRCSKSRATLALLEERGVDVEVVEYLKQPPTVDDLKRILKKLGTRASAIVRTGEAAYKDSGLKAGAADDKLLALIAREPVVLERPIVEIGRKARIGRPPENVLELID